MFQANVVIIILKEHHCISHTFKYSSVRSVSYFFSVVAKCKSISYSNGFDKTREYITNHGLTFLQWQL